VLVARDQARYLAIFTWIAAVANVVFLLWAIPTYGAVGAAWGSLLAYALPSFLGLVARGVRDVYASSFRASVRPALAALILLAVAFVVHPTGFGAVVLVIVVGGVALIVTCATSIGEIRELLRTTVE